MAAKKSGLGKGLESLFSENAIMDEGSAVKLNINDIEPNRDQPRKEFDEESLAELSDSIAQHGVLQPLLVRPILDGGYQLVAGERRWRAARRQRPRAQARPPDRKTRRAFPASCDNTANAPRRRR